MTEMVQALPAGMVAERVGARLKSRYAAERRFRFYGVAAIVIALSFLAILLTSIVSRGWSAFTQTEVRLPITFVLRPTEADGTNMMSFDFAMLIKDAFIKEFPDADADRDARREFRGIISQGAEESLREYFDANPSAMGQTREVWLPVSANVDQLNKGKISRDPESGGQFSERALRWIDQLKAHGQLGYHFNRWLFMRGDSRQPEMAGLLGAVVGTFYSLLVTVLLSFPMGVAAAVYLEEFAVKNRWTDLIEVNINNLAAVPSIVFGLLGLEIFLNTFGLPRSSPLVGGLCLTLVSLPTIIIASRVALKAVPPWIREAASGLGASRLQTVSHHVLPLAMPGILTGTIIGMARAIGESAPLLMIGMVAFIVDVPKSPLESATALPVQIYLWAANPERAFVERTSAAICVLLVFLALMNAAAIYLRKKFERRW